MIEPITSVNLKSQKRILIVDSHPLVRAGVIAAIGDHPLYTVCGEAAGHHEVLPKLRELNPDLVTMGLNFKNSHWLELIKDMRVQFPKLIILVVSTQDEYMIARRAIQAGANGYVTMQEPLREVRRAMEHLFAGELYVSRCVSSQIARQMSGRKSMADGAFLHALTDRELEIFELTGNGLCVRQIAGHLNLGKSTVETYRNRIKEKLCLQDSSELLQSAIRWKCGGGIGGQPTGLTLSVNSR